MGRQDGASQRTASEGAGRLFFAAGFLLAGLVGGLRALEAVGTIAPRALPAGWHGHELLLGFVPALIGGYLVAARAPGRAVMLFVGWLAARLALPASTLLGTMSPMLLSPLFTLALAVIAGAPFRGRNMRAGNRAFALVLLVFPLADIIFLSAAWSGRIALGPAGLLLAADGVLAMLFLMGGRILGATANGLAQRSGRPRIDMRQGMMHERLGALLLAALLLLDLFDGPGAARGIVSTMAAGVVLLRLRHWRVAAHLARSRAWRSPGGDHALTLLTLGYGWIALGLLSRAIFGDLVWLTSPLVALHPALIGGLGTLGATISLRTRHRRVAGSSHLPARLAWPVLLFTPAAFARLLSIPDQSMRTLWMMIAGLAWVAACLLVACHHARSAVSFAGPGTSGSSDDRKAGPNRVRPRQ